MGKLTDLAVRSLPIPESGQKIYYDSALPAFGCRVSQGGTRSFFIQLGADKRFITIGRYPTITLSQARDEARRLLAEKTLGKHRPEAITFDEAKELYLAQCRTKNKPRTVQDYTRILKAHFNFGRTKLGDITPADINRRLDKLASTPSEQMHAGACIKIFMRWAVRRHYIATSPCEGVRVRLSTPRTRILSDDELRCIWKACSRDAATRKDAAQAPSDAGVPHVPRAFSAIVRLLILTGQRRGEIAAIHSSWLHDDILTIPANVAKNGREHSFPLSPLAISILKSRAPSDLPKGGILLFPARGKPERSFNGWGKNKGALDKASGVTNWTLHDLRRTFATVHARIGTPLPVIERLLNHASGSFGGIVGVYQRHDYIPEMRAAQQAFEAHLLAILSSP